MEGYTLVSISKETVVIGGSDEVWEDTVVITNKKDERPTTAATTGTEITGTTGVETTATPTERPTETPKERPTEKLEITTEPTLEPTTEPATEPATEPEFIDEVLPQGPIDEDVEDELIPEAALPKTSGVPALLFYLGGAMVTGAGVVLRKRNK